MPPVRAGFSTKTSLKPGINIAKIKVKTALQEIKGVKFSGKNGYFVPVEAIFQ